MLLCVCFISAVWRSPWASWKAWSNRTRHSISTKASCSTWQLCMSWNHLAAPRKSRLCWRQWPVERGTVSTHNAWNWCKIVGLWQQVQPQEENIWSIKKINKSCGDRNTKVGWSVWFPKQLSDLTFFLIKCVWNAEARDTLQYQSPHLFTSTGKEVRLCLSKKQH